MRHKSLTTLLLLTAVMFFSLVGSSMARYSPRSRPFIAGQGYHTYRNPAIVKANNGDLLAFCEGRDRRSDDCVGDIVLRRSSNSGNSWTSRQRITNNNSNGNWRYAHPYPIVLDNGRIILLYCRSAFVDKEEDRGERVVFMRTSDDHGKTWSSRTNITSQVKKSNWGPWYGLGPGHGFVKQYSPNKGRIIVGARHTEMINGKSESRSHIIYSGNNGQTWQIGGQLSIRSSEVAVVELGNGNIYLNARAINNAHKHRIAGISTNGGGTISSTWLETQLPCPQHSGSLLRYGTSIIFSNARDTDNRTKGTVQRSADNGQTWPLRERYHKDGVFSSYSDLVRVDGDIGILVEWGPSLQNSDKHKEIRFVVVPKGELGL